MARLFTIIRKEEDPLCIVHVKMDKRGTGYEQAIVKGLFYRIVPTTGKGVFALQMLEPHLEKFAPAAGNGVLVTPEALEKFA